MSDLQSSSEHREKGLMSPNLRAARLRHIIEEMRSPDQPKEASWIEVCAAQDLCFRLYSAEVSDLMAKRLGVTRQQIRETLRYSGSRAKTKRPAHLTTRGAVAAPVCEGSAAAGRTRNTNLKPFWQ